MRQSVLITGGSGLLALNWAIYIRDRHSVTLGLHSREVPLSGVSTRFLNLESVDDLSRAFDSVGPSLVIHAAGMTSVEGCEAHPELARHINIDLAVNVATACARHGCSLAHISTDHLFSGREAQVSEATPVAPQNMYARTKAEAELRVLEVHPAALVVRTNFYGWGPSYRHSFSDVIIQALCNNHELILFDDVFYTPILIEAAAQAVHDLVAAKARGIFHVTGDERLSKYQFGLKVARQFGLEPGLIRRGSLAEREGLVRRPLDMSLSNHKACRLLGRTFGAPDQHIVTLLKQQRSGLAQEIQEL